MKKTLKIVAIIAVIVILVAIIVIVNKKDNKDLKKSATTSSLQVNSSDDLKKLITKIYGDESPFPTLDTREIDLSDDTTVQSTTGLEDGDDFEFLVVSEPMISSQAYSLVLGKVKSGVNADKIVEEMFENINPRKWICVSAEKVCATSSGDVVCLVMSNEESTIKVYEEFKRLAKKVGKEYEKDVSDGPIDEFDLDFGIPVP